MYRTGDRARALVGGDVVLLGRVDRQTKVRGIRVEPEEVEQVLATCPGVRRGLVTAADGGLTAYLLPEPGADVDLAEVHHAARRALPEALCPTRWAVLDRLPLTANGKVDAVALAALPTRMSSPNPGASGPAARPTDDVEHGIAAIWCDLLGINDVSPEDHFFALGGTSLLLGRLVALIRARMLVEVSLREIYREPTVIAVAELVRGAAARPTEPALRPRSRTAVLDPAAGERP